MVTQLQTGSIKDVNLDADLMKTISLSLLPRSKVVGSMQHHAAFSGIMDRFISAIRTIFGIVTK